MHNPQRPQAPYQDEPKVIAISASREALPVSLFYKLALATAVYFSLLTLLHG